MSLNGIICLALIPARGGSKGVHRKNMRFVGGVPLIKYTIDAALGTRFIDQTYVSSDDNEILNFSAKSGASTIFRTQECSNDLSNASSVVDHFFNSLDVELMKQDPYVFYLQPTSPLRTAMHLNECCQTVIDLKVKTLLSVVKSNQSPFKSFIKNSKDELQALFDESMTNKRRQDLPDTYYPNGAIYLFRSSDFYNKGKAFPSNGSFPYLMLQKDSIDIDTEEDLELVNRLMEKEDGSI
ncbi:MAG: CMP-sialic acid synthetase [Bdellovibrio sp. CG12_big_fil_rev_8_21_14_0_65_39_13]|nr:MAG: CMP-sialic acid synthetase [Bdellovibrio sp. CG22_combo_CG10-13_8_21_14_all_39_27]PIQ62802.1 MAG: CMP-sialic acid synthetase [Bdellovibrio sp. CG12_big_fil_rev_8_21_14_0_65_39_13]PIR32540.1 MAG: CMP-sialic acid synthetase [Bdellovibrio sp. CG11_big_fil_rev_8_21_14_0_20_39_38]